MIRPIAQDLYADRETPFKVSFVDITGISMTGADLSMQIRRYYDAPNDALVTLETVGSPDTLGLYIGGADVFAVFIDEATMGELPYSSPARGGEVALAYDIHVTALGATKQVFARGSFIVRPGATRA